MGEEEEEECEEEEEYERSDDGEDESTQKEDESNEAPPISLILWPAAPIFKEAESIQEGFLQEAPSVPQAQLYTLQQGGADCSRPERNMRA